ncbi:aspartic peptidase domain-containing protein, partial [Mycena rosella]
GITPVISSNWEIWMNFLADKLTVAGLTVYFGGFYLITNQTATFLSDPFDGIMGFSPSLGGLFEDVDVPAIFGMLFTPKNEGGAELTMGGVDTTKFTGTLLYSPGLSNSDWEISSLGIYVNGEMKSSASNRLPLLLQGTSTMLFTEATALAIYSLISPDIVAHAAEPGTYGIACDRIPVLPAIIDIAFAGIAGQGPFNLTIPSSALSSGPFKSNPALCQMLINVSEGFNLVGLSLLKYYYSVWHVDEKRMGFAPNGF